MTVRLELFYSPYCRRCRGARDAVRAVAGSWPETRVSYREINVLEDLERAVAVGVLRTPALAIDGTLVAVPVSSRRALGQFLRQRMSEVAP